MKRETKKFSNADEYINELSSPAKGILEEMRKMIKQAVPKAEELISYNMPAFTFHGMLVYYAAYKNHIGFYPFSSAIKKFEKELSGYELSKGTIRFSLNKPVPLKLISKIVKFRMEENIKKYEDKITAKELLKQK